jgi:hypothetical protein
MRGRTYRMGQCRINLPEPQPALWKFDFSPYDICSHNNREDLYLQLTKFVIVPASQNSWQLAIYNHCIAHPDSYRENQDAMDVM